LVNAAEKSLTSYLFKMAMFFWQNVSAQTSGGREDLRTRSGVFSF